MIGYLHIGNPAVPMNFTCIFCAMNVIKMTVRITDDLMVSNCQASSGVIFTCACCSWVAKDRNHSEENLILVITKAGISLTIVHGVNH